MTWTARLTWSVISVANSNYDTFIILNPLKLINTANYYLIKQEQKCTSKKSALHCQMAMTDICAAKCY